MSVKKVSIHLITWNGEKYIEECLNSILEQSFKDYLLLVIDNGSVDNCKNIIEQEYLPVFKDKIKFVKNKDNIGFAKAHNQAMLWTDSEYVLVLNQDVILDKDFLKNVVEFLDENKQIGSVTGKLMRWEFENTEDLIKSTKSDIIDSLGLKIYKNQRVVERGTGKKDKGKFNEPKEVFGVSGACPVYRRKSLEDIRYEDEFFDNDFFSYKEDIDIAYRLRWRAWQNYYLPTALAYHDRTAISSDRVKSFRMKDFRRNKSDFVNFHSYKNHLFVLLKNLSNKNLLCCLPYILYFEFKKFIYILLFERTTLKGIKGFFGKYKKIKKKRKFVMSNRLIKDEDMRKWFN